MGHIWAKLLSGEPLEYAGRTKIVPKNLQNIIKPKPKIKFEGPIYELASSNINLRMGCYSDAVVIFKTHADVTRVGFLIAMPFETHNPTTRFHGIQISNGSGETKNP